MTTIAEARSEDSVRALFAEQVFPQRGPLWSIDPNNSGQSTDTRKRSRFSPGRDAAGSPRPFLNEQFALLELSVPLRCQDFLPSTARCSWRLFIDERPSMPRLFASA